MRSHRGFTLIELMVTVAIVAILAAIAIPSYSDYLRRGRITEAISGLSGMRVKMEQFFQDNRSYSGACTAGTVAPAPANTTNFTFACSGLGLTAYVVTATGVGPMNGFAYTINASNTRVTTGVPTGWTLGTCGWVLRQDGSC